MPAKQDFPEMTLNIVEAVSSAYWNKTSADWFFLLPSPPAAVAPRTWCGTECWGLKSWSRRRTRTWSSEFSWRSDTHTQESSLFQETKLYLLVSSNVLCSCSSVTVFPCPCRVCRAWLCSTYRATQAVSTSGAAPRRIMWVLSAHCASTHKAYQFLNSFCSHAHILYSPGANVSLKYIQVVHKVSFMMPWIKKG